jgi:hypothetical protein
MALTNGNRFLNKYTVAAIWKLGTALTFTSAADVDITLDTVHIANHGLKVGDVVNMTTSTTLPTGFAVDTAYYIIVVDGSTVAFATSRANAIAGTKINITGVGSGTQTITPNAIGDVLSGVIIPSGHIIVNSAYDCPTTCTTSGTDAGTMAITVESAGDIVAATAVSTGTTWDNVTNMVAGTPVSAATAVKLTADRELTFTLATKSWTAGEVIIYLDVVPAE